jgi:DNA (cytosine-5)-methyltransferase 1
MNELALFAGAGGGILGGHVLGWRTVCAVEFAAYPRSVLLARQRDGMLPAFPVWDDVRTFDGKPWRGHVDVISGGFPCQDISVAGKGDGLDGERSGLWSEMARIIGEVQPRFAFVENSPMLTSRGLDKVLGDLSTLGYDAVWGVVGASDAGAPHRRERIWILAYAQLRWVPQRRGTEDIGPYPDGSFRVHGYDAPSRKQQAGHSVAGQHPIWQLADPDVFGRLHGQAEEQPAAGGVHAQREPEPGGEDVANAVVSGCEGEREQPVSTAQGERTGHRGLAVNGWWSTEPGLGGVADELADRLDLHGTPEPGSVPRVATGIHKRADRLKAIGNGQVPAVVRLAWHTLYARYLERF